MKLGGKVNPGAITAGAAAVAHTELAREMVDKLDDQIREALNELLGTKDWQPEELRGRLQRVSRVADESIVYFLDRKPFMRVWPVTVTSLPEAPQILQANQRIERIRPQ